MFFWSKKREDHESIQHLQEMNENLRTSFSRIRADIEAIKGWLEYFHNTQSGNDEKFKELESKIDEIGEVAAYIGEAPLIHEEIFKNESSEEEEKQLDIPEAPKFDKTRLLEGLTETQKSIFFRLGTLLQESGQQWISIKTLAQELYPDRPYDQVRSTLSEYLSILIESGVVIKKRVGKATYVTITEIGLDLFSEKIQKNLRKIVLKNKAKI